MVVADIKKDSSLYVLSCRDSAEPINEEFDSFTSVLVYLAERFSRSFEYLEVKSHIPDPRLSSQIGPVIGAFSKLYTRDLMLSFIGSCDLEVVQRGGSYYFNGEVYPSFARFITPFIHSIAGDERKKTFLKLGEDVSRGDFLENLVIRNNLVLC